jgi:hypothetical protein
MMLSTLFTVYAVWCLFRGAGFIFWPAKLWSTFNVHLDKHNAFPVQILGGAFIATAIVSWTSRNAIDASEVEGILLFIFAFELTGALLSIYGAFSKAVSKHVMGPLALHSLFSIAFGYFLF